jgi:hypothetical protein
MSGFKYVYSNDRLCCISGYASEQGVESSNNRLIKSRGEYITNILKGGLFKKLTDS